VTIETYVDALGDTYYLVHPAGISYYDQTAEVVTKANSSVAYLAGSLAICRINTATGELWQPSASPSAEIGLRQGVVTADSLAGVATVSIKRVPRRAITSVMSSRDGGGTGGDSTNSGRLATFDNQSVAGKLPLVRMVTVSKPSAETWASTIPIYGYLLAGATLYTSSFSAATTQQTSWVAGGCCLSAGPGTTVGYIHQSIFSDSILGIGSSSYLAKDPGSKSISATISGTAPTFFARIFTSQDRLSVSNTASATCNILLGTCVGIDKSVTPNAWSYVVDDNMALCTSVEAVNAALGGFDTFLIQQYTASAIRSGSGGATSGFTILATKMEVDGKRTILAAPRLTTPSDATFMDLAYEPILPSPFDNLRIIWSYSPAVAANFPGGLYPAIAKRTNASPTPYVGMTSPGRLKPQRYTTLSTFRSDAPYIGIGSSCSFPLIPESRSTPYIWKEMDSAPYPFNINFPWSQGQSIRGAMFPSGVAENSTYPLSNFEWRWEIYDFASASWVAATSYVAGTGAGANWSANVTPPTSGIIGDEVYLARLSLQLTFVSTVGFNCTFKQDFTTLGAWPFDIVKAYTDTDAGGAWCGNPGWIWPSEPAGPSVAWSNEPVFSLVGNLLSLSSAVPVAAVAGSAKFAASANALNFANPALAISYDDGDSAQSPAFYIGGTTVGGFAYAKGSHNPRAEKVKSSWSWGDPLSMNIYPSSSGNKRITVRLYYSANVTSAYGTYAVPRVITQTFTLP
jgi:hypothetical protein